MKANAIFFEGCSREHMNGARKVSLILQRALRPSPQRSLAVLPRLKEVDLLSVGASTLSYCDVLREDDLDGAIRGRMTWQHNPQRRLFVVVDVEARLFTAHLDLDLRPRSRHKVDVRFVLARCFFPKPGPGPLRKRDVLSGMIPALLIIGATVCGA